jgi:hypothetical protein
MSIRSAIARPSGFVPLIMSGLALHVIVLRLVLVGAAQQAHGGRPDEGSEAHIWQILMSGQVPIGLYFAARWLRSDPLGTLSVVGFQVLAFVAAAAPVFLLKW